jgi:hypothetical protein
LRPFEGISDDPAPPAWYHSSDWRLVSFVDTPAPLDTDGNAATHDEIFEQTITWKLDGVQYSAVQKEMTTWKQSMVCYIPETASEEDILNASGIQSEEYTNLNVSIQPETGPAVGPLYDETPTMVDPVSFAPSQLIHRKFHVNFFVKRLDPFVHGSAQGWGNSSNKLYRDGVLQPSNLTLPDAVLEFQSQVEERIAQLSGQFNLTNPVTFDPPE